MECFYVLTVDEICEMETYGIAIMISYNDCLTVINAFPDISMCRKDVETLVNRCNSLDVSAYHITDIIEDFLSSI